MNWWLLAGVLVALVGIFGAWRSYRMRYTITPSLAIGLTSVYVIRRIYDYWWDWWTIPFLVLCLVMLLLLELDENIIWEAKPIFTPESWMRRWRGFLLRQTNRSD